MKCPNKVTNEMPKRPDSSELKVNDYSNIWMLETFSNLKWTQGKV